MSKEDNGGPAQDASLRDYFAGKAMHAILSNPNYDYENRLPMEVAAEHAYEAADAMLEARKK